MGVSMDDYVYLILNKAKKKNCYVALSRPATNKCLRPCSKCKALIARFFFFLLFFSNIQIWAKNSAKSNLYSMAFKWKPVL